MCPKINPVTRPVVGYVATAGTSYRLGSKPLGLGYVASAAHAQMVGYFGDKFGFGKEGAGPKLRELKRRYGVTFESLLVVLVRKVNSDRYSFAIMDHVKE